MEELRMTGSPWLSLAVPSTHRLALPALLALVTLACPSAWADGPGTIEGHWQGALKAGGRTIDLDLDFVKKAGGWAGDISIPAQGAKDLPLEGVKLEGDQVDFKLAGVPGDPSFHGKLTADGSSIKGTFTQAGKSLDLSLSRAADPIAVMKRSLDGFDAVIDKAIKDFKVPGLAIAVVKDGEVIYAKGFGQRNLEKHLPVTPRTLFAIGSCTKAFTTFVMGKLVEEGQLDWDTPMRTYIPGFRMSDPIATEAITPRDLVTHRCGLPRHDMVWYNSKLTGKDLIGRLAHFEASEPFRSKFQYNNMMFLVAGHLIERIEGRPWETAVRKRIFEPLGMTSSNFSVLDSQKADDFATPYDEQEGKVRAIPFRDITNVGPAGSINSNVLDMARWVAVQTHGGKLGGQSIISPTVLAELHTPQMSLGVPSDKKEISAPSYALGWMVDTYRGHRRVHHGGGIDGFTSDTCLFPDDGMGMIVLTNQNGTPLPGLLVRQAADRLLGLAPIDWLTEGLDRRTKSLDAAKEAKKKKESARRSGTNPGHPLEEYAGDYEHPGYGLLEILLHDGQLVSRYNGIEAPLEHWHFEVFNAPKATNDPALDELNRKLQFQTDFKGYVDGVLVPMEPSVKPILFVKRPDKKLSDPEYLKRFAGEYELAGQTLTIRLQGHVLMLEQKGAPATELVPDRNDEFNLKRTSGVSLRFVSDGKGKVVEMALTTPDGVYAVKRK
jgi:CubicO group peptidase (beta-lactamase class C family)